MPKSALARRTGLSAALVLGLMASTAALAGPAQAQDMGHHGQVSPSFSLSATGEVRLAPDMATITTGVVTEAPTAAAALAANARAMNQVVEALRRQGIEERHIQTSGLSLSAQYDYVENQPPRLRGYQASNEVTVRVEDLDRLGQAIDAVVAAGANQINGISFGLRDPRAAQDQARRAAVAALEARARLYAEATGMRLLGVRTLTESGGYAPPPPMRFSRREATSADSTPVLGGEILVAVTIEGVYDVAR